jgi:hypothetical protein
VEAAAATAFRPAAPQLVQPHVVLALCRELLLEHLPDVWAALLAAGVAEVPLHAQMAPTLTDRSPRPGDERIPLVMTRRACVDWVLRRCALAEPGVELRGHTVVTGLLADPGEPPRVRGVRTDRGELSADLVVDAAGRRTGLDDWLREHGGGMRDPEVFTAVLRSVPFYAPWLDVLEPITDVYVMGGLHNTLRRLVVDGRPVVLGLHAVGDTVCTTNPTMGRGLSLALRGAVDLMDALRRHPDDPAAQAIALDVGVGEHIEPFYADQAALDEARLAQLRHTVLGAPPPPPPSPDPDRLALFELRSAAPFDPDVFRAYNRLMGALGQPDDVYRDPEMVARVRAVIAQRGVAPPIAEPDTERLSAVLGG